MLGYVLAEQRGAADRFLLEISEALAGRALSLAGAVQVNRDRGAERKCDMDLHILSGRDVIRISQNLGTLSRGCRLDPEGLERAVGLAAAALERGADLLIVNKFGKQELDGRGFRPLIGEALACGVPVLTAVNPGNIDGFAAWAEDMATPLPLERDAVLRWCLTAAGGDVAGASPAA